GWRGPGWGRWGTWPTWASTGWSRGGATPRRKPRGKDRPAADRRFNRALARRRIQEEHAIGRLPPYPALGTVHRRGRDGDEARVRAVSGLVNRIVDHKAR